jgi:hypothetical protein
MKQLALAVLCAGFSAIALLMIRDGKSFAWFGLVFFGLGVLVFLLQVVPGASYLKLDPDGLTIRSLFRSSFYKWSEIAGFVPGDVGGNRGVVFNFTDDFERHGRLRRLNVELSGAEGALPDTYGLSPERLAQILNEWKIGLRRLDP